MEIQTSGEAALIRLTLVQSPQSNLANSLVGRTPGLTVFNRSGEPGRDGSQFLIRRCPTLGDSNLLIVIDGVANRLGGLDRLDPTKLKVCRLLKMCRRRFTGRRRPTVLFW